MGKLPEVLVGENAALVGRVLRERDGQGGGIRCYPETLNAIIEAVRQESLQSQGVEGWVLVPKEPTEEMLDGRARDILLYDRMAMHPDGRSLGRAPKAQVIAEMYRALLAAVPHLLGGEANE